MQMFKQKNTYLKHWIFFKKGFIFIHLTEREREVGRAAGGRGGGGREAGFYLPSKTINTEFHF